MNENKKSTMMYEVTPVVAELNKVAGFDPLQFLRKVSTKDGERSYLDLKYKKLWFRLKYPQGRIKVATLKITEQIAIIEAKVFLDKGDSSPTTSFIAQRNAKETPGGLYIESAQHAAIDGALVDAGFGMQFSDLDGQQDKELYSVAMTKPVTPLQTAPVVAQVAPIAPVVAQAVQTAPVVAEVVTAQAIPSEEMAENNTANCAYTSNMSVDAICKLMTLQEANAIIVESGSCSGWSLAQVAERRAVSLKWFTTAYSGDDNILRAGAKIVLENMSA